MGRIILVSKLGLELIPALIAMLIFMKNDEDEMIIGYCLVYNSRTNDDNEVVLQNSNS